MEWFIAYKNIFASPVDYCRFPLPRTSRVCPRQHKRIFQALCYFGIGNYRIAHYKYLGSFSHFCRDSLSACCCPDCQIEPHWNYYLENPKRRMSERRRKRLHLGPKPQLIKQIAVFFSYFFKDFYPSPNTTL